MKNAFKFGFLALALSLTFVACNSEKKATTADSTMSDTSMKSSDTTMMKDTTMTDTVKKDTVVNKM